MFEHEDLTEVCTTNFALRGEARRFFVPNRDYDLFDR